MGHIGTCEIACSPDWAVDANMLHSDYSGHEVAMGSYSLAEAKAHLGALIDRVVSGETVTITRGGKEVARILPPDDSCREIDADEFRALTDKMPMRDTNAGEFIRKMRDEERY
jgi:prevent-host-death family protein